MSNSKFVICGENDTDEYTPVDVFAVNDLNGETISKENFVSFDSGAVRDIRKGKGRCDLLPLKTIYDLIADPYLYLIHRFMIEGPRCGVYHLINLLRDFLIKYYGKCDADIYTGILEVSVHFEEGAEKYGEHNWEKGIPIHSFIDSAIRHRLKMLRGDTDERHDRAFAWNILCCIWTCENKPELVDI